jgi:hypothetical protein
MVFLPRPKPLSLFDLVRGPGSRGPISARSKYGKHDANINLTVTDLDNSMK